MIPKDAINPFEPGSGRIPPAFPGREREQAEIRRCIERLKQHIPASRDIVISAPRGNGKTTFLSWCKKEIRKQTDKGIDIIAITPDEITDIERLLDKIALPGLGGRIKRKFETGFSLKVPAHLISLPADAEFYAKLAPDQQKALSALTNELKHRCRKKPVVVIMDEAHTLQTEVGLILFNTSQKIREELPFQMILAGTPGLQKHLGTMSATFWERSNIMRPGLLSHEDAHEAIVNPFEKFDVTFDRNTLDNIIQDSQGYPYFTQLWGEKLFNALQERQATHVDETVANQALDEIEYLRQDFYQERFDKLHREDMIPAAARVAKCFENSGTRTNYELEETLGSIGHPDNLNPRDMKEKLIDEGYIWRANLKQADELHPGIPSLMKYVKEKAPPVQKKK